MMKKMIDGVILMKMKTKKGQNPLIRFLSKMLHLVGLLHLPDFVKVSSLML